MFCRLFRLRVCSILLLPAVALLLCARSARCHAQEAAAQPQAEAPAPADPVAEPPAAQLEARIAVLSQSLESATLEPAARQALTRTLAEATGDIESGRTLATRALQVQQSAAALAEEAAKLNAPSTLPKSYDFKSLTKEELDTKLAATQVAVTNEQQKLEQLKNAVDNLSNQKRDLLQQQAANEKSLTEVEQQIADLPPADQQPSAQVLRAQLQARQFRLQKEKEFLASTISRLNAEQALNLPSLRVAGQKKQVDALDGELKALKQEADRRRKQASSEEVQKARAAERELTQYASDELRKRAVERRELAAENELLVSQQMPSTEAWLKLRADLLKRIQEEREKIQSRIERFGATGNVGKELLYFHNRFPDRAEIVQDLARIDEKLSELREDQFEYSDREDELAVLEEQHSDSASPAETELIDGYQKLLDTVQENTDRLAITLADLDDTNRQLLKEIDQWEEYKSEHSLWFRSHDVISLTDLYDLPASAVTSGREFLRTTREVTGAEGAGFAVLAGLALVAFLALLIVQRKAKTAIQAQGELARRRTCTSLRPTIRCILLTGAVASEWPVAAMLLGNLMEISGPDRSATGVALVQLGLILLWLNCLRHAVRSRGLAEAHFDWSTSVCRRIGRWTHMLILVTAGPLFCLLFVRQSSASNGVLERTLFVVFMVIMSLALAKLLLPTSNAFVKHILNQSAFLKRTRYLWVGGLVCFPFVLAVLSVVGYHFTALQLADRCGSSVVLFSLLVLTHQVLLRWLKVSSTSTRLQLAKQRAEARRLEQEAETTADGASGSAPPSSIPAIHEEETPVEVFGLQASGLIRNGTVLLAIAVGWAIWADVLPALRILDREALWHVTEEVAVETPTEEGEPQEARTETVRRPVTVGNLLFALFAVSLTYVGVRQLPGLLEVVLQSQSGFDAGMRYTICTVTRYVVLIVGAMFVFHNVGLRWSQVQWLVAGLSVGLGFGLQEVFANFVSGLIMLIERPVRIGDIVTIDGVSGIVSRIRIRATSITDWDRREYIVPNREFVTGKLLNWTLSDTTNRVVVNVGVSYGNNPDQAREIMLNVACSHPNVLTDPPPIATFESFGDSSLSLVLRAYLPNLDERLMTITQLHTEIHRRFREAGIEIPFPQRDVHMIAPTGPSPGD